MKIVDGTFDPAPGSHSALDAPPARGRGWSVFVEGLSVPARIGIHPHEHGQPQPLVIDASLVYRAMPDERDAHLLIDYEHYCGRITSFLATKAHTRLLETLAVELAVLSFREFGAIEALTLSLYKPKIRAGTRRIGIEFDWTRHDYRRWAVCQRDDFTQIQAQDPCVIREEQP